jgi:teichuronic acid biosynthesis glycosyltransferase TuaG
MDEIMKIPVVSVIMPAYNASNYIQEAINSVIAQTYTNWELIIVDDGSTDETSTIIADYCIQDWRIKGFYQENGKQGKARNLGISKAIGSYIAFLDADDLWMSEKLEIQLQEIKERNVDLVFSDTYVFYDNNLSVKSRRYHIPNFIFKGNEALEILFQSNSIPILTVLAKKEKIVSVNCFSENLNIQNAEDYHLWLKMIIGGCVFYSSDKILAAYRVHNRSATNQDNTASKQILEVFFDLKNNNIKLKKIMIKVLKREFQKRYKRVSFSKKDLNFEINKNCLYIEKKYFYFFFKILNSIITTRITKKILIHLLNA